jgi:uncharacterized protein YndB with AHSA1/START domain
VRRATGRGWDEWIALLDAACAQAWSHKQIVAWLAAHAELSGWWRQSVAVGYEQATGKRVPGETADVEFQVGVRVTVVAALATVWEALVSPAGKALWLGSGAAVLAPGVAYETPDGTRGEIRVVKPEDRIRFTVHRPGGPAASTAQIALVGSGVAKTAVTFHHEKLRDAEERETMPRHWKAVADKVKRIPPAWEADVAENEPHRAPHAAQTESGGRRIPSKGFGPRTAATSPAKG